MDSYYTREELMNIGFASVGENVLLSRKASIYGAEKMHIGSNVRIDDFCFLSGKIILCNYIQITTASMIYGGTEGVVMGDFSTLGPRVVIHADSDDYTGLGMTNSMVPEKYRFVTRKPVKLCKHVIIGTGCVILPGVTIGEGTSIGAMSFIKKSLGPWMMYAGNPCKPIKPRSKQILELEKQMQEY